MSQTQTVEEAFSEWSDRLYGHFHALDREDMVDSYKAGAEWAAKTPAECAVLEAAIVYSKTTGGGSTVRALRNVLNAVAALEREKAEGGSNGSK